MARILIARRARYSRLVTLSLRGLGFDVTQAPAAEAVERAGPAPDLILMDVRAQYDRL
jgi:CheY-like chemotaxis protein